jgi:cation diffusion facilitator CzcD-associated flavoprotein CzcO
MHLDQVPELAKLARHVTIIQRSPMWVAKKTDFAYPAFVRWSFLHLPFVYAIYRTYLFLFNETMYLIVFHWQWTAKVVKFGLRKVCFATALSITFRRPLCVCVQSVQFMASLFPEEAAARNKELVAKLVPDYPVGCTRLLISLEYLLALKLPHVDVVCGKVVSLSPTAVNVEVRRQQD